MAWAINKELFVVLFFVGDYHGKYTFLPLNFAITVYVVLVFLHRVSALEIGLPP